jgi:hypothetical protein
MPGRILSLVFALAALAGAVLYAQKKGRENPRRDPVFDTSKSGTPTPIDATAEEKEEIRKQNEYRKIKNNQGERDEANELKPVQQKSPEEKWPTPAEPGKKKRKKVMPSSKSYIPDSPE